MLSVFSFLQNQISSQIKTENYFQLKKKKNKKNTGKAFILHIILTKLLYLSSTSVLDVCLMFEEYA